MPSEMPGLNFSSAATKYARKRVRSFSPSSREIHAIGPRHSLAQTLSSIVFPYPAGAETRVSFFSSPWFNCSISRRRGTSALCGGGINNLVDVRETANRLSIQLFDLIGLL